MATLPLFPLGTVLLPGTPLTLHIFEPRYRQLVLDLVEGTVPGKRFGVVGIKQGWEVGEDNVESMYEVGCSWQLDELRQLPEGRFRVVGQGEQRFQVLRVVREEAPYLIGEIQWLADAEPEQHSDTFRQRLIASARSAYARYHGTRLTPARHAGPPTDTPIERLAYLLADEAVLPVEDRQALLAERSPLRRLRLVRSLLLREAEFLHALRAIPMPMSEFSRDVSTN